MLPNTSNRALLTGMIPMNWPSNITTIRSDKDKTSSSSTDTKRMATPLEMAIYIVNLSTEKNSYMTGQTLTVSGGE